MYTYLIGWSNYNKYYYGVRFAKDVNPEELWVDYFTSSKHVKKFRQEVGEPDIIEVRKIFDSSEKARAWEHKVLRRLKVIKNNKWLNKTDNCSIDPELALNGARSIPNQETRKKMKKAHEGKRLSEETKAKISVSRMGQPSGFKRHTTESKKKLSEIGKTKTGEMNSFYGKQHSEETKRKISETKKRQFESQKAVFHK